MYVGIRNWNAISHNCSTQAILRPSVLAKNNCQNKKYFFHTPNLSPDSKTGHIADWTEEMFIKRFRKGKQIPESPMPWGPFSRMTDDELKAIYRYLKTVKPVERKIEKVLVIEN